MRINRVWRACMKLRDLGLKLGCFTSDTERWNRTLKQSLRLADAIARIKDR